MRGLKQLKISLPPTAQDEPGHRYAPKQLLKHIDTGHSRLPWAIVGKETVLLNRLLSFGLVDVFEPLTGEGRPQKRRS
jgi:hypothetical protein